MTHFQTRISGTLFVPALPEAETNDHPQFTIVAKASRRIQMPSLSGNLGSCPVSPGPTHE